MSNLDERSDRLDEELKQNPIDKSIETLVKDAARRRLQLRLLGIFIVLQFLFIVTLGVVSVKTAQVAQLAQSNKAAVIQNCETANDSRNNQRQLWGYVLSLTPQQPRTPEQDARVAEFARFVDRTFAPRDCQAEANK